jgi:hypothetical protein
MKLFRYSAALGFYLFFAVANQATAIDLWYDFEGDSGTTATDKLTSDGTQNGTAVNAVTLNAPVDNVVTAGWGSQAAFFDNPPAPVTGTYSTFEIPNTTFTANYSATLAGWVNYDITAGGAGRFRVLSSFAGGGAVNNALLLDAGSGSGQSRIRGILGSNLSFAGPNLAGNLTPGYHHYAMTVDGSGGSGAVTLYFDGAPVATGSVPAGYVNNANLRIGEDVNMYPQSNSAEEQLVGNADDVLVLGRALTAADISSLYNAGAGASVSSIVTPSASELGVYYDFEGDSGNSITDKFTLDGAQNSTGNAAAMVDTNAAHAKLGSQSGVFSDPRPTLTPEQIYSQITTTASGSLGANFTLSAVINPYGVGQVSGGVERLFSNYGGGSTAGSLIVDFNPATTTGIRVYLPSNTNTPTLAVPSPAGGPFKPDTNPSTKQTLTVTYKSGGAFDELRIYLDGVEISSKLDIPAGTVQSLGANPLRIGEDRIGGQGAFGNENYNGTLDDVLILSRALTPEQVAALHSTGAAALLATLPPITVAGDYNKNGVVDAADYVLWRNSDGQTGAGLAADGNSDDTVDTADLDYWRTRFGSSSGSGSGDGAAVPEPGCSVLVLILAGLAAASRGKRSR